MENGKRLSFGYEDTDKKIEIDLYGLIFEINDLNNIKEIENLDKENNNAVEIQFEKILGDGAIEKINKKRISDGYKKMDLNIELGILGCVFETYAKGIMGNMFDKLTKTADEINKNIDNTIIVNREQRRNYNRNQYRGNKRNYRRYY